MTAFTDAFENYILDRYLRNQTAWTPGTVYAALGTGGSDSTFTEVANSNNYARTAIIFGSAASGGSVANTAACTFPQASGSWGTISYGGLCLSNVYATAFNASGNGMFHGSMTGVAIGSGDTFEFAIGGVTVTVA